MLPILAYGAYTLGAVYGAGRLYDTARYWSNYYKNTGYRPRYPFLKGAGSGVKSTANVFSNLKRL